MKQISIIAAAMAFAVASSTAMAEPQKRPDKATHRAKSLRHSTKLPNSSSKDKLRQYGEDKLKGWYKEDRY